MINDKSHCQTYRDKCSDLSFSLYGSGARAVPARQAQRRGGGGRRQLFHGTETGESSVKASAKASDVQSMDHPVGGGEGFRTVWS